MQSMMSMMKNTKSLQEHLNPKRVVIGMSGGVDSTVAAFLLKEQGYEVIGVTMKVWDDPTDDYAERIGGCCSLSSVEDARRAAEKIGIPFYVMNFKKPFKEKVIDAFISEYEAGRTPNPCVVCNKHIKFDLLLKKAHELGAYYVATGHYARIEQNESGRWLLKRSDEAHKDQTYMLYNLTQYQLAHTLMPLGNYASKQEIRQLAEKIGFDVAGKPDSQEICFIPDDDYVGFLEANKTKPFKMGWFVDSEGKRLAPHKGIIHYTIGQRKGLGITFGKPVFVVDINPETGDVVLGDGEAVYASGLEAEAVNWISADSPTEPMRLSVKIRHTTHEAMATVEPIGTDGAKVTFEKPQRAVSPGQSVVFYDGDVVVGGGLINKRLKE